MRVFNPNATRYIDRTSYRSNREILAVVLDGDNSDEKIDRLLLEHRSRGSQLMRAGGWPGCKIPELRNY